MFSESIDRLHKPHNASVPYPTMSQFITKIYTILLQKRSLRVVSLMQSGIWEIDQLIPNVLFSSFYW